jgi:hypothetical protein
MPPSLMMTSNRKKGAWIAVLFASTLALSLHFACVAPRAGVAVIAALTLPPRQAAITVVSIWIGNQLIGYLVLDYPVPATSLAWGAVLGVAALGALGIAARMASPAKISIIMIVKAFSAAFTVYELVLFVFAYGALGGTENYSTAIIGQVLAINALAMALLLFGAGLLTIRRSLPFSARQRMLQSSP